MSFQSFETSYRHLTIVTYVHKYRLICHLLEELSNRLVLLFRLVISGNHIKELPSIAYYELIKELNANGNNLNQPTKLAYVQDIDGTRLKEVLSIHECILLKLDKQIRGNS